MMGLRRTSEIIGLLAQHDWALRWSGNWPLLDGVIQRDQNFARELANLTGGTTLEFNVDFYEGNILTTYHSKQEYSRIHRAIRRRFEEDSNSLLLSLKSFSYRTGKDLATLEKISQLAQETLSSKQLAYLFEKSRLCFSFNAAVDLYCFYAEDALLPILKKYLKEKLGRLGKEKELINYLTVLTTPNKPTEFLRERRAFFELLEKLKPLVNGKEVLKVAGENEEANKLISRHLKAYGWLPVLVNNPPKSFEELCGQIKQYLERDYSAEKKGVLHIFEGRVVEKTRIFLEEIKPNAKVLDLILGFQEMAFVRTQTGVVLSYSSYLMIPLYTKIAERLGISYTELKLLLPEELAGLLVEKKEAQQLIEKHKLITAYINDREKRHVFNGDAGLEVKNWVLKQLKEKPEKATGLIGTPASLGIAQGRVKVVMSSLESDKLKNGEILVAPATSVDFVPAMERAAAIVTETGGITSHAAIVSREFGVPCIVGVKKATSQLKDNDLVEVDAETGVIRVLRRNAGKS